MSTECYDMVRGSGIRVTALTPKGAVTSPVRYAATTGVASVRINPETESGGAEVLRNDDYVPRIVLRKNEQTIRDSVDIEFLRVDPGLFSLISNVVPTTNAAGNVVGFDSIPRRTTVAFALEVWSQLAGNVCVDGRRQYGYTLFPFLKGGRLSGFTFQNGLVSFNLIGARTARAPKWGVGPYEISEGHRLLELVPSSSRYRQFIVDAPPPAQADGVQTFLDIIDNGTPADPGTGIIDGGDPDTVGAGIVSGNGP